MATGTATALVWTNAQDLSVALPEVSRDLLASLDVLQWTITAFMLAGGALILATGRLADIYGRRPLFLGGIALLTLSSVPAALADASAVLITSRALMGIGGAMVLPASLAIVSTTFHGRERGLAMAIWIATGWAATSAAPLLGGVLTELGDWRLVLWFNVPVGATVFALSLWACPDSRGDVADRRIDWAGLATASLGLLALMLAISEANTLGWDSAEVLGLFAASAALLGLFIRIESRAPSPLVYPSFFGDRTFVAGFSSNFALNFVVMALLFFMALYLEEILGFTPAQAGLLLLPKTLALLAFTPVGWAWSERAGPRLPIATGLAAAGVGLASLTLISDSTDYAGVLPGLVLVGIGVGLMNTQVATAMLFAVRRSRAGAASAVFKSSSMLGASFGVAASVALFQQLAGDRLRDGLDSAAIDLSGSRFGDLLTLLSQAGPPRRALEGLPERVSDQVIGIMHATFAYAMSRTMWLSVAVCAVAAVIALWLIPPGRQRAVEK